MRLERERILVSPVKSVAILGALGLAVGVLGCASPGGDGDEFEGTELDLQTDEVPTTTWYPAQLPASGCSAANDWSPVDGDIESLEYVNRWRRSAGLPCLTHAVPLGASAFNYSTYLADNFGDSCGSPLHVEKPGCADFLGATYQDRERASGFGDGSGQWAFQAPSGEITTGWQQPRGTVVVAKSLMSLFAADRAPYHFLHLMDSEHLYGGCGWKSNASWFTQTSTDTCDFGRNAFPAVPGSQQYWRYPTPGSTNVPASLQATTETPLPPNGGVGGTPVLLFQRTDLFFGVASVDYCRDTDGSCKRWTRAGGSPDLVVGDRWLDSNLVTGQVLIFPKARNDRNTGYSVKIKVYTDSSQTVTRTWGPWSFKTGL
jgi:hypothetical protein